MKIQEVENKALKRAYEVVVNAAEVEQQIERELREVGKRVKIPGFRPGKIPAALLRQRYGDSVMGDVLQRSANEAARHVVKENNLTPALAPDVKVKDYKQGGDLTLSIVLEVMPTVPEIDLSSVSIERPVFEVEEAELSRALEVLAQRQRSLKDKGEAAKAEAGDVVMIDFKGFIGKEAFEGGEAKGYHLELGSGQFIPGFEDQLIGAKAGSDVTVKVPFPKDYHKQDLAGKEARFEVTVHQVKTPELPEINEEFAASVGFESLADLKNILKGQLEQDYGTVARNRMKKALFDALETLCTFDVPEKMVQMEFDSIWQQYQDSLRYGGEASEQSEDELKKEYRSIAERRVRLGIFLSDVARKHKIEITREELAHAVQKQAGLYPGQERKIFEFYRDHPEHVNELRGPILEEKAVDQIFSEITVNDVKTTVEALLKEEEEGEEGEAKAKPKAKKAAKTTKTASSEEGEEKPKAKKAPASKK